MSDDAQRYRAALETVVNGDEPRSVGSRFRDDGAPSKHDRCTHGRWMYEDCGNCVVEFVTSVLAAGDPS